MIVFYLNESVSILKRNGSKALVQFDDGFEEWIDYEDLEVYRTSGTTSKALVKQAALREDPKKQYRFERNFGSRERVQRVSMMPCVVCGVIPCENAHVRSRGAGGGKEDVVPLCSEHHREQGSLGIVTFEEKYNVDLKAEAHRVAQLLAQDGL